MPNYIVIREYQQSDKLGVGEAVQSAYTSNVNKSFINALSREITFQLIVMCAAMFFIFIGIPITYCLSAIPIVLITVYMCIYLSHFMKSSELMHKRPVKCWVAEACYNCITDADPKQIYFSVVSENESKRLELGKAFRKIIGTVSVTNFIYLDDTAWLYRFAVEKGYRHKGVGHALVETAKTWSRANHYSRIFLVVSECQDTARQIFLNAGFQMKQMYHKHIVGSIISLLMYQLECDLVKPNC
ncbi:PREDICTED: uncharacterized protein LOC108569202 [Nicrophorus vespilloides]|uniref:Uncharacterized protein LOC108569202 n=1 Tax=Nicrophorus vespilloides TaxID=110193 RepID=A0ABM1NH56_NICVS|nr:PREDICTED: uncharacterized protein LOC108569202 [Nicrophorus vespilloides]